LYAGSFPRLFALMPAGSSTNSKYSRRHEWVGTLGVIAAWLWSALAGGGGLLLLIEKGPLPITNGWFALLSGICACPLTALLLRKLSGFSPSGRIRICAAAFFFVAGRIALLFLR